MVRKEVNDEIQRSISFIKYELPSSIEKNEREGRNKEKLYIEIESIVKNYSQNCGTQEGGEDLVQQEWTNCEIDYDQYHCSDCSQ